MSSLKRFFKPILSSALQQSKMEIPRKFVEKYGDELSDLVKFTDPVGGIWLIKLEKIDNKIWFREGLLKFLSDHSVEENYFLILKYKENSTFLVKIFDLSTSEIEYSRGKNFSEETIKEVQAGNTSLPNNPSFTVTLQRYNVHKSKYVYVPMKFGKSYMPNKSQFIKLLDGDDNEWDVFYNIYNNGSGTTLRLSNGWSTFVNEKKLKEGDVCNFERIGINEEVKLKVNISRSSWS